MFGKLGGVLPVNQLIHLIQLIRYRVGCVGSWFACLKHVLEKMESAGDSGGKLTEKGEARVDENALAVFAVKSTSFQVSFACVVSRENGRVMIVPLFGEIKPPFLHPAGEIIFRNGVWRV